MTFTSKNTTPLSFVNQAFALLFAAAMFTSAVPAKAAVAASTQFDTQASWLVQAGVLYRTAAVCERAVPQAKLKVLEDIIYSSTIVPDVADPKYKRFTAQEFLAQDAGDVGAVQKNFGNYFTALDQVAQHNLFDTLDCGERLTTALEQYIDKADRHGVHSTAQSILLTLQQADAANLERMPQK